MADTGSSAESSTTGYRVLARKYRPSDFSQLIGQDAMVRTLTNAFEAGRIAQAWMLTGVRGVGKTTTARILARSLNYRTSACNQPSVQLTSLGEHCQAIMDGRHVDVMEMDAASHTGIDDVREIIDQVRYAPVSARYKVYVIDEVHMLSNQAFNGLLKTLEEPPPHVKFIFATTEIRKVPITVLSRCQRFDLKRVDASIMTAHLRKISGLEGISVEDEALAAIARAGEGSVRDCLSILDQAIAHGDGAVSLESLRSMLGLADRARIIDLFEYLMAGNVAAVLTEFRAQYDDGAEPSVILGDIALFNHLVTRLRFVPDASSDQSLSLDERTRGLELSKKISVRILSRTWQMLLKGLDEVRAADRPVNAAEMLLIRIAHAADLPTLDEALSAVDIPSTVKPAVAIGDRRSTESRAASQSSENRHGNTGGGQPLRQLIPEPDDLPLPPPDKVEGGLASKPEIGSLADIAALAEVNRNPLFNATLKRYVRLVRLEPGRLEISLEDNAPNTLPGDLSARLQEWTGLRWIVTVSRDQGGLTLAEQESASKRMALDDAQADPTVAAIIRQFPGARVVDVRVKEDRDMLPYVSISSNSEE